MKTYTVKIDNDGTKFWYFNGKLHREDGPAIEDANGDKCWYINGQLHRKDGPAVEYEDGYKAWWINGKLVTEQDVLNLSQTLEIEGVKYTVAQIKAALKKVA
jgi:hypothetical protein